ncbi:Uncharacterised protein [Vibrio cholerae]|nr:Uncharacterised protein [Vibrio cholerae]
MPVSRNKIPRTRESPTERILPITCIDKIEPLRVSNPLIRFRVLFDLVNKS